MHDSTVFVVDDEEPVRRLVEHVLRQAGLKTVGFSGGRQFLDAYDSALPGCLVTDVHMPGMTGLELHQSLAARGSPLPVILLTAHADVQMAVQALKSNVVDVIEKPFEEHDLRTRVASAVQLDRDRRQVRIWQDEIRSRLGRVSAREREVLDLVVQGLSSKQIAHRLLVSEKTIESHRASLMSKLEARNLADLVRLTISADPLRAVGQGLQQEPR